MRLPWARGHKYFWAPLSGQVPTFLDLNSSVNTSVPPSNGPPTVAEYSELSSSSVSESEESACSSCDEDKCSSCDEMNVHLVTAAYVYQCPVMKSQALSQWLIDESLRDHPVRLSPSTMASREGAGTMLISCIRSQKLGNLCRESEISPPREKVVQEKHLMLARKPSSPMLMW